jgi:poly(ADP-ribose) glycohydrolase ARH3
MGAAIGDALGMPFETLPPGAPALVDWANRRPSESAYFAPRSPVNHPFKSGQWTDDTQMSMALAEHLLENKFYDPSKAARKYLAWYQSGDARGVGGSVRKAMDRLAAGEDWSKSGEEGSFGNGSAMRAGVIGAYHHRGTERIGAAAHWARVDAAITHRSPEAYEGSAAMAVALSHLSSGGDREALLDVVLDEVAKTRVFFALEDLKRVVETWDESKGRWDPRSKLHLWLVESNLAGRGPSSKVWESVPVAFAAFLAAPSFFEAVEVAILAGGDTDTVGSMTGAMAGAFWGLDGIPSDLVSGLERHDEIRNLELKLLA